jgi:DNA-binding CsgD family transcriptional regulator
MSSVALDYVRFRGTGRSIDDSAAASSTGVGWCAGCWRAAVDGVAALTPRERQICEHAASGMSNLAIAHALFLSITTVETHLAVGYRKLGVTSRRDLAAKLAE